LVVLPQLSFAWESGSKLFAGSNLFLRTSAQFLKAAATGSGYELKSLFRFANAANASADVDADAVAHVDADAVAHVDVDAVAAVEELIGVFADEDWDGLFERAITDERICGHWYRGLNVFLENKDSIIRSFNQWKISILKEFQIFM